MKASPIKEQFLKGTDFIVVRELTGGIYFGDRTEAGEDGRAVDTMVYTVPEVERIARLAAKMAMGCVWHPAPPTSRHLPPCRNVRRPLPTPTPTLVLAHANLVALAHWHTRARTDPPHVGAVGVSD